MAQQEGQNPEGGAPQGAGVVRNPYILSFCKTLVEKKGEKHEPENMEALLIRMYELYEYMLGKNMINSLPEDIRTQYLAMSEDLRALSYEKIGQVFGGNIANQEQIMKETMKEFADLFMKNRLLNIQDYPSSG